MTVCSGSALAASSSLRCVANQAGTGQTVTVSNSADTWVRVQLCIAGQTYYVKGSDFDALRARGKSAYISSSEWQPFDINANTAGTVTTAPTSWTRSYKYAAIRVDANGNIVGVGASGGGAAIAGTCWTSFMIAP